MKNLHLCHLLHVDIFSVQDILEVLAVLVFLEDLVGLHDLCAGDPAVLVGDFLEAGDLAVLVCHHCLDKVGGIDKAFVGSCVEPGEALSEQFDMELIHLEIDAVEVCDLIFAARRGLEIFCKFDDAAVVEIKSGHTVIALGMFGLFFDGNGISVFVKFHDAEALGVVDLVAEDSCAFAAFCFLNGGTQSFLEAVAGKNIVSQDHGGRIAVDKLFAEGKGLCQTIR